MKSLSSLLIICCFCWGCSEKKIDLSGEVPVKTSDFLGAFPKTSTPFMVADTNLAKTADTLTFGYKLLQQFFPDSALTQLAITAKKITIHPLGLIEKEKENYLLLTITDTRKITRLVVLVTDKKNKYLAAKELLRTGINDGYLHIVSINREPTFLLSREKTGKEEQLLFTRAGWVYAKDVGFMVVVNDSNEGAGKSEVINPIDTLPAKNKYSGEYGSDKKNFISLRDGSKPGTYLFFIHFEKNEGTCVGELKGEMKMNNNNTAIYKGSGDPCVIDFSFSGNEITLKEQGSCGNHRGIKCFFDDSFPKKRSSKKQKK